MRALAFRTLAIAALVATFTADASAQALLNQWNFNGTTTATYRVPSSGLVNSGTTVVYPGGFTPQTPGATILATGAAGDPGTVISGTTYNRSLGVLPPAATGTTAIAGGITFVAPTTGYPNQIQLSWSQTVGFRSSRYWQILLSTSGTAGPFFVPSGGTGSVISQVVNGYNSGTNAISGTATVSVSSSGLIDFRTIDGNWLTQQVTTTGTLAAPLRAGWVDNITYTLPTDQWYGNNPNFAFAISALWDPGLPLATTGSTGLVSSFSGLTLSDTTSGYQRNANAGGDARIDLMTVSAVPEPSTFAMLGTAAMVGGSVAWRWQRRRRRVAA